jgi:hypothetical protein
MNINEHKFIGVKETLNKLKQWFFDNVCKSKGKK